MSKLNGISVTINYKLAGSAEWKSINLLPEEYFDLDEGEKIAWDSVPIHNHAKDYLNIGNLNEVLHTKLEIVDALTRVTKLITETFWNDGRNRAIERSDTGPGVDYWELIIEVMIGETPLVWEILRLDRVDGVLVPNYHGLIQRNEDGSEIETRVKGSSHECLETRPPSR